LSAASDQVLGDGKLQARKYGVHGRRQSLPGNGLPARQIRPPIDVCDKALKVGMPFYGSSTLYLTRPPIRLYFE
jgi:hypothetical protein